MKDTSINITVIGAGINGLVAANYLARAGHQVTLLERSDRVGGACVSETLVVDGIQQDYALGFRTPDLTDAIEFPILFSYLMATMLGGFACFYLGFVITRLLRL
ncbi:MAG: FAD-dependent oxidoreductase [Proteobacteria bacterium]|nr:FAD-dependent oxidoreductase [Pseudomonadota bacterium]